MATGRVRAADICDRRPKAPLGCDSQLYSNAVENENDFLDVPHPSVIRVAATCSKSFGAIFTIAPTGTCRNFVFLFPIKEEYTQSAILTSRSLIGDATRGYLGNTHFIERR
jgi:hypothetical protein